MHRLVVNPGTANAWEIPLAAGVTSLGRSQGNTCPLDHPSVAPAHCQVTVMGAGVLIKDLDSGHPTFVDERPVTETVLLPGQTIRLGEIAMRFESQPDQPALPAISVPPGAHCKSHPNIPARFVCPKCGVTACDRCVHTRPIRGVTTKLCRACGAEVMLLPAENEIVPETKPFFDLLPGTFAYPFRGDGKIVLLAGTVIFLVLDFVARHTSILGILVVIVSLAYLISFLQRVLVSSASGKEEVPDLPDFSDFEDVAPPLFQFLGAAVLTFGPAITLTLLAAFDVIDTDKLPSLGWAKPTAYALGCLLFPMMFLAISMNASFGSFNPLRTIASIFKIPTEYLCTVFILGAVLLIGDFGGHLLSSIIPLGVLPDVLLQFTSLYLLMVDMRMLGLLYRSRKEKLAWFE